MSDGHVSREEEINLRVHFSREETKLVEQLRGERKVTKGETYDGTVVDVSRDNDRKVITTVERRTKEHSTLTAS